MQAQRKISTSQNAVRELERPKMPAISHDVFPGVVEGRYEARLAANAGETASALRLRHEVFSVEIGGEVAAAEGPRLEFDEYDFKCRHLIVVDRVSGATVGTYRLNSIETAKSSRGFYSVGEFTIDDLPEDVLEHGIEIGRACIAKEHRNTKVLFLLWKALLAYLHHTGKRYFFGCCSIFTQDEGLGGRVFRQLKSDGHFHERIGVVPKKNAIPAATGGTGRVELPSLFNMYLRLGARVCSPPIIDRNFGTIDFFVVFDVNEMSDKYRRMFTVD